MQRQRVVTAALALTFALAWSAAAAAQQTAEDLYQAALHQEQVQGDLQQAITLYQRILSEHPNNRVVAANAQLHIGLCYETLGLTEAPRAYQRVIDNYPAADAGLRRAAWVVVARIMLNLDEFITRE